MVGMQAAHAQTSLTMAQALDAAWQRAVESAAAAGDLSRAEAERAAAAAWWAAPPALELRYRSDRPLTDNGVREAEVGVSLPLWLPGQRAAKGQAAAAEEAAARSSALAARLQLAGALREAAAEVHLRQAETLQFEADAQALDALSKDVARRVGAGDLARADALAARAELLAAQSALGQARGEQERATLRWRALTGLHAVPAPAPAPPPAETRLPDDHPALLEAARRVEFARRKLDLASSSKRSPPELLTWVRQDVGGRGDPADYSVGIGIRLPFGTDDRNAPLLAAASSELALAEAQQRRLRDTLQAAVDAQRAAVATATRQRAHDAERAALLRERAALIDKSFKAGETPLPDLLRAMALASQAAASAGRQQIHLEAAQGRLQQAMGLLP